MRHVLVRWLGLVLGSACAPGGLQAQRTDSSPRWGVGAAAGVAFPAGAFSETDDPGASVLAYFSYALGSTFSLGMDVGATWTPHKGSGHSALYDVLLDVAWRPRMRAASPRPFLLGSVGSVAVDIDDPNRGRPAVSGGAGVSIGRGDARMFVMTRYVRVLGRGNAVAFIPLTVGFATRAP